MDFDNRTAKLERLQRFDGLGISETYFNLTIGLVLVWGFILNALMALYLAPVILGLPYFAVILLYFAGSLGGSAIVYGSRTPAVSFAGFTLLAASMGLILTWVMTGYSISTISTAFFLCGTVTLCMIALSTVYPAMFAGIGRSLGITLLITIAVELIAAFLFRTALYITDYVVVILFCGYVGYDWSKAQQYPKTLDNAIDCAADIYVDVVNLFIRILRIIGRQRD